jgi:hypothetical protein
MARICNELFRAVSEHAIYQIHRHEHSECTRSVFHHVATWFYFALVGDHRDDSRKPHPLAFSNFTWLSLACHCLALDLREDTNLPPFKNLEAAQDPFINASHICLTLVRPELI